MICKWFSGFTAFFLSTANMDWFSQQQWKKTRWNICRSNVCCQLHARFFRSDINNAVLRHTVQFIYYRIDKFNNNESRFLSDTHTHIDRYTIWLTNWQLWRCLYFVHHQTFVHNRSFMLHSATFASSLFALFRTLTRSHHNKQFSIVDDISLAAQSFVILTPTWNINVAATQFPIDPFMRKHCLNFNSKIAHCYSKYIEFRVARVIFQVFFFVIIFCCAKRQVKANQWHRNPIFVCCQYRR